ncbi:MAG: IPT/TIG domain-containing protein, partial [Acidimicrobiales bacterium]
MRPPVAEATTRHRRRSGRITRAALGSLVVAVALPVASLVVQAATQAPAAAATPTLVQSAAATGSNASVGSTVAVTATLPATCTTGDTLVAVVTIAQDAPGVGLVSATPSGWQRLYEHTPTTLGADRSPYQGWFALNSCSGVQSVTFSITSQGNPLGTSGSVVVGEYSGLPNPVALDFGVNGGSGTATTSSSLSGSTPAATGELTLTTLSFYGSSPTAVTPSGWTLAKSETSTLPAFLYFKVGTTAAPSASFSWTPSSSYEMTMIALKPGPAAAAPNVVQETQGAFSAQTSWQLGLSGVRAGDALIAMVGTSASGTTGTGFEATGVSGGGVSWQKVAGFVQSGNGTAEVWVGFGSTGTSGATPVTVTMPTSTSGTLVLSEVSGLQSVDTSSTADGSSSTPTAATITPRSGDFVAGLLTANPTSVALHPSPTWSTFSVPAATYAAEWLTNAPGTASAPQWTTSPAADWIAVQAAFSTSPPSSTGPVGSFGTASGEGVTTLAVSPAHIGDVLVLGVKVSSPTITASSVAGGGASGWTRLIQHTDTSNGVDTELWVGPIATTGSATVTVTFSSAVTTTGTELVAQEFSSGLSSPTWSLDTAAGQTDASSTTVAFPSLTPAKTGELYVGYAWVLQEGEAGSTGGVTYDIVPTSADVYLYDTGVNAALAPSASQTPAGTADAVGALLQAAGSSAPAPTITGVSPTSGSTGGGTTVTVTGTGFTGATAVHFGSSPATTYTVNSPTQITATAPAATGTVDVTVTTPG